MNASEQNPPTPSEKRARIYPAHQPIRTLITAIILIVSTVLLFSWSLKYQADLATLGTPEGQSARGLDLYSGFAAFFPRIALSALAFIALHRYMMGGLVTVEQLRDRNVAYGLFLVAISIVVLAANIGL